MQRLLLRLKVSMLKGTHASAAASTSVSASATAAAAATWGCYYEY